MCAKRFEDGQTPLRNQVIDVLAGSGASAKQKVTALLQCTAQLKNKAVVEEAAKEGGLVLSRFQTNDHLELYYDLKRGRNDVGYISKGWDESGFRN